MQAINEDRLLYDAHFLMLVKQSLSTLELIDLPKDVLLSGIKSGKYAVVTEPMTGRLCVVKVERELSHKPRPGRSVTDFLKRSDTWERIGMWAACLTATALAVLFITLLRQH